jgi:outer membrane receptor for ferrienterochelin and colicins
MNLRAEQWWQLLCESPVGRRKNWPGMAISACFFGGMLLFGSLAVSRGQTVAPGAATDLMALSLEQLLEVKVDRVYGASRYEQNVAQAPASVSLVTRDEIQKQGHRTLADVLRTVNGVYVTDDRNYSYLGIRGFNRPGDYNSRVLLLVDGHRINDNLYDQGLYGTEAFLDVDLIERVEVVRGPSSSLYGDNAFFGVVNVITRSGRSVNGLETTAEAGNHETFKAGITYGRLFTNGVEWLASISFFDSGGEERIYFPEFDSPTNNNGVARNADADRAYHFYNSLRYADFTLTGGWSGRQKDIPTASFETTFNDGGELTVDERAYVDLKWEREISETVTLMGRAAYDYSWYRGEYPYGSGVDRVLNLDEAQGEWVSTDWQANWQAQPWARLIMGGDYSENLTLEQRNFDESPAAVYLDDSRHGRNYGLFAQAEVNLRSNLVANVGGRWDYYSTFGSTANPRLALIYQPFPQSTFKALYGEAFRAPNAYELYYSYPGLAKDNPDLQPETIRTYELVWEQRLSAHWRASAAGYYYEVENLVSQTVDPGDGLLVFENLDAVQAMGLELGLERRSERGWMARLAYAVQNAEDETTERRLSNSPRHLAKLNLIAPLWGEHLWAGVDLQYSSPVVTVQGGRSDAVFLANATLFSRGLGQNLEASISIYNLFDERDGYSGSAEHLPETIPLTGRSFRAKLTYRF